MATVKLGLKDLSVPQKIQLARVAVTSLTGNPAFPTPIPALTQITSLADATEAAVNEQASRQQAAQLATVSVAEAEVALDTSLTSLGAYVQSASGGDESKILSSGLSLRAANAAVGLLPAPDNFAASLGDLPGDVDLTWNRIPGAASYVIQFTTTDPNAEGTTWTNSTPSTRSSTTVTGLKSGTRYWFRVAALGAAGQGPWSDPATKMAQ